MLQKAFDLTRTVLESTKDFGLRRGSNGDWAIVVSLMLGRTSESLDAVKLRLCRHLVASRTRPALLGCVVFCPILPIGGRGNARGAGLHGRSIGHLLAPDDVLHRDDVLAWTLALLEVRASAERRAVGVDDIRPVAGLRRVLVAEAVLFDADHGRDRHAPPLASRIAVVGIVGAEGGDGVEVEAELTHRCTSC